MRILMTTDTMGGIWSYSMELARSMRAFGTEFALMTMGDELSGDQREEANRLPNVALYETKFRLEWMDDPWRDVDAAGDRLLEIESQFVPDLVHINGFAHGSLPWKAPVLVVAHSCVSSWWQAVHGESAPARYQGYVKRVTAGLMAAKTVVAPTRAMLSSLQEHYGFTGEGRVIFNGRHSLGFSPGIKSGFVLGAGRVWDAAKNFAILDRVAPQLNWPVFIAGDSMPPNGEARNFPNLHSLGRLPFERLAGHLGSASIYALPALYEPFGLSVLEAALSGCALVLGDIPSLRELWD